MAQLDNKERHSIEWLWSNARCNDGTGILASLFFSEQLDDIDRAKEFCGGCPVREACFEAALTRR
jgi:WhiB family transcriptional regulator, redox-sensing transcriptional regulator